MASTNPRPRELRLASLERDGYFLESGEAYHARSPVTFEIPDREDRDAIGAGRIVKLLFNGLTKDGGSMVERMWVRVLGKEGDMLWGELDNIPSYLARIKVADAVVFKAEHIIDIYD